jgi:hypothetical protein
MFITVLIGHSSCDTESTKMSICGWMDEKKLLYIQSEIFFSHKEWNPVIGSNIDRTG